MHMQGKSAVGIGVGSRIGRATAKLCTSEGAHVLASDSKQDAVEAVVSEILAAGGIAASVTAPHGSDEGAKNVADRANQLWGKGDGLGRCPGKIDFW